MGGGRGGLFTCRDLFKTVILKCSGHILDISSCSIFAWEDDMFKRRSSLGGHQNTFFGSNIELGSWSQASWEVLSRDSHNLQIT